MTTSMTYYDQTIIVAYVFHIRVGGEVQGCKGTPKSFDLVKLREKSRDVWAKYVITFAKSLKIWANSPKIQAKMAPNLFRLRNWCQIT